MQGSEAPQQVLSYAAPLGSNQVDIRRVSDGISVLVGPMPAWVFVTGILPHSLLLAAVVVLLAWSFLDSRRAWSQYALLVWLAVGVSVLGAAVNVAVMLRHRLVPRSVAATRAGVYFSDARTGGNPRRLPADAVSAIGVRRRWWCPWILELVAVPEHRFLALRSESSAPVALLAGLDRPTLNQIAAELRQAIRSAPGKAEA